jgi:shikimate kinase
MLIFLIGPRGAGKTTVASLLAGKLGWQWVDADEALERRFGQSISDIFTAEGEAGFRHKEALVLEDLCRLDEHVIAAGGGVVLRPENRACLKSAGRVVGLTAGAQCLWNRLQADPASATQRPALMSGGIQEVIDVLQAREPLYAACAEFSLDTTHQSPEQVAAAIVERLSLQSHPKPGCPLTLPSPP